MKFEIIQTTYHEYRATVEAPTADAAYEMAQTQDLEWYDCGDTGVVVDYDVEMLEED